MQRSEIVSHFETRFPDLAEKWSLRDIQLDAVEQIVNGSNALAIMPTGSGKSMVYWMAGSILGGTSLVISPLIALIDEQADKLRAAGFSVLVFHSGVTQQQQIKALRGFVSGEVAPDFVFASPERIATDSLFGSAIEMRRDAVHLVVIDEIHCVSQWGVDFRPFYRRIPAFLDRLYGSDRWPRLLGLTATLNPKDRREISEDFRIPPEAHVRHQLLMRNEIALTVKRYRNEDEKEARFWELLDVHRGKKTLVYLYRKTGKRSTEWFAEKAEEKGISAIFFHGDMTAAERAEAIASVQVAKNIVVFATNAFGMGIDIPDIRVVIHYMIPESVEQYYQEVGRAARDRSPAEAYLLYTDKNVDVRRTHFIDKSFPSMDKIQQTFTKITSNTTEPRSMKFFDDEDIQRAFTYLLDSGAMVMLGTGYTGLSSVQADPGSSIRKLLDATRTGNAITTSKKTNVPLEEMFRTLNMAILSDRAKVDGSLDKCMFVQASEREIAESAIELIQQDIEAKRQYKHNLLDYLVGLCGSFTRSEELHQEIGLYLGVDKHQVGRIYETSRGEHVRSKSEVIIANLLAASNISYVYEQPLYYEGNKWIEPDFTISTGEKTFYWEHLGMLGLESYDARWLEKRQVYETYFPDQLVVTHESAVLSRHAKEVIADKLGVSVEPTSEENRG